MINAEQLRCEIVRPACDALGRWSQGAENLLLLTCAVESRLGTYLRQLGGGPALGIFQMEPATYRDIWTNYLAFRPEYVDALERMTGLPAAVLRASPERMVWDLRYAAAMARIHYLRVRSTIPGTDNWPALAVYWKDHYNTRLGAGTPGHAMEACRSCGLL